MSRTPSPRDVPARRPPRDRRSPSLCPEIVVDACGQRRGNPSCGTRSAMICREAIRADAEHRMTGHIRNGSRFPTAACSLDEIYEFDPHVLEMLLEQASQTVESASLRCATALRSTRGGAPPASQAPRGRRAQADMGDGTSDGEALGRAAGGAQPLEKTVEDSESARRRSHEPELTETCREVPSARSRAAGDDDALESAPRARGFRQVYAGSPRALAGSTSW